MVGGDDGSLRAREEHFAAAPGEHVAHPSPFSTLFPHLHHSKTHQFRLALLVGLGVVIALASFGLVAGALLSAMVIVPTLYIVYIFESRVYGGEPVAVLGTTVGGGVILGAVVAWVFHQMLGNTTGDDIGPLVILTIAAPVVQVAVVAIPALILRKRCGGAVVDGLVFGVAAGLGFATGESLVRFLPVFSVLSTRSSSLGWLYALTSVAVLVPLMHGAVAGAISAAVWRPVRNSHTAWLQMMTIPVVLLASIGFSLGGQLIQQYGGAQMLIAAWQVVMAATVLIFIRYLVHHILLQDLAGIPMHAATCPHCNHHAMCGGFCPRCGAALTADVVQPAAGVSA